MITALAGIDWFPVGLVAELYTLELKSGAVHRFTTLDADIVFDGDTYLSGVFNLERGAISISDGVEVDSVDVTIYQGQNDTLDGLAFPLFVRNGGFDSAWLDIKRATKTRTTPRLYGMVTDASADVDRIYLTVSAPTALLNVDMPRNRFTAGCPLAVYSTACGLSRVTNAISGTVASGSSLRVIECDLVQDDNFFDMGKIEFLTGANAGVVRSVRDYVAGRVVLGFPLRQAVAAGDTFTIWKGCDKRLVTCTAYGNEANFRGFPHMPKKEASV